MWCGVRRGRRRRGGRCEGFGKMNEDMLVEIKMAGRLDSARESECDARDRSTTADDN